MAIDTAAKRSACLDHEEVWAEAMPIPSGGVTDGRYHALWNYSGITYLVFTGVVHATTEKRSFALEVDTRNITTGRDVKRRVGTLQVKRNG